MIEAKRGAGATRSFAFHEVLVAFAEFGHAFYDMGWEFDGAAAFPRHARARDDGDADREGLGFAFDLDGFFAVSFGGFELRPLGEGAASSGSGCL